MNIERRWTASSLALVALAFVAGWWAGASHARESAPPEGVPVDAARVARHAPAALARSASGGAIPRQTAAEQDRLIGEVLESAASLSDRAERRCEYSRLRALGTLAVPLLVRRLRSTSGAERVSDRTGRACIEALAEFSTRQHDAQLLELMQDGHADVLEAMKFADAGVAACALELAIEAEHLTPDGVRATAHHVDDARVRRILTECSQWTSDERRAVAREALTVLLDESAIGATLARQVARDPLRDAGSRLIAARRLARECTLSAAMATLSVLEFSAEYRSRDYEDPGGYHRVGDDAIAQIELLTGLELPRHIRDETEERVRWRRAASWYARLPRVIPVGERSGRDTFK